MPRNTSVSLGDHVARFIDQQMEGGRYGSASDRVRVGLRLLDVRGFKLEALRSAVAEGEGSSNP